MTERDEQTPPPRPGAGERPTVVGLTGGIAAGKSLVARTLRGLGAPVIDADALSRQVSRPGSPAFEQVVGAFGDEVLGPDGQLDRQLLGRRVFGDPAARRRLEQIMHPAIAAAAEDELMRLGEQGHRLVVYEAALLVETGRHRTVDLLVVVVADDERRVRRLMARDRLGRADAERRLAAQAPQARKAELADYLIDNSGAVEQTRAQVESIWRRIVETTHGQEG